jgi:hypothetical protein
LGCLGAFFAGALAFGVAGAFGFAVRAAAFGLAGVVLATTGALSVGLLLVTTNGIGVVAAGSGTLYGATLFGSGATSTGLAENPNKRFKKSNISVS